MREIVIGKNDCDQRVDKFLSKALPTLPKSLMYKAIRNKKIKVNRKRCEISQRLQEGDTMQLFLAEEFFMTQIDTAFLKVPSELDIVYEDENLLIVNKAKGLLAHRDQKVGQDNLMDRILHYLYIHKEYDPRMENSFVPALCHRIDRNTQGLVIAAKNAASLRAMNAHIKQRKVRKKYVCIAQGVFDKRQEHVLLYHCKTKDNVAHILPYPKEGYKPIEINYQIKEQKKQYALVEVELLSGKSHQIRAMLAYLSHPLYGDVKYGAKHMAAKHYQMLCAYRIEFVWKQEDVLANMRGRVIELDKIDLIDTFHALK